MVFINVYFMVKKSSISNCVSHCGAMGEHNWADTWVCPYQFFSTGANITGAPSI